MSKFHRTVSVKEIEPKEVAAILERRFAITNKEATKQVGNFLQRARLLLSPYWYRNSVLKSTNNCIAVCLAELYSSDCISILVERTISFGTFTVLCEQMVSLEPALNLHNTVTGRSSIVTSFFIGGFQLRLSSYRAVVVVMCLMLLFASIVYAVCFGMFLYGTAVFMLFVVEPEEVSLVALKDGSIGLALLCYLVAVGALFGGSIRYIYSQIRRISSSFFRRVRSCGNVSYGCLKNL